MEILQFLAAHWFEVAAGIAVLGSAAVGIINFIKKTPAEKYKNIRAWLLYAVTEAEAEWGSGTGRIKLGAVYDSFVTKFPFVKIFISQETFLALVDDALEEMRELLETNERIAEEVIGTNVNTD
jgi:hypothetical protein